LLPACAGALNLPAKFNGPAFGHLVALFELHLAPPRRHVGGWDKCSFCHQRVLARTSLGVKLAKDREARCLVLRGSLAVPVLRRAVLLQRRQAVSILLPRVRFGATARADAADAAGAGAHNGALAGRRGNSDALRRRGVGAPAIIRWRGIIAKKT
jgi:hypothetical protein